MPGPASGVPRPAQVADLEPGMVIFKDIYTLDSVLLISRGTVVTESLIRRLENYVRQGRVGHRVLIQN